jgi:hypothetical protein
MIEPVLSPFSALIGAAIGGAASLAAAVYTQWHQDRLQRVAREADKREAIYGEFIMRASKALVRAHMSETLSWTGDEQHLVGLINRMRLFAPQPIIEEAEAVIRKLIHIAQLPRMNAQELSRTTLNGRGAPDLLLNFSLATHADLQKVYEQMHGSYGLRGVHALPERSPHAWWTSFRSRLFAPEAPFSDKHAKSLPRGRRVRSRPRRRLTSPHRIVPSRSSPGTGESMS